MNVGSQRRKDLKLIICVITFELTRMYAHGTSTSRTDGQTHRQTDGRLTIGDIGILKDVEGVKL